jgi:hypothetical protein
MAIALSCNAFGREFPILHYWGLIRKGNELRFDTELSRLLLPRDPDASGWETLAFAGMTEAIETIALQRSVQRWSA